MGEHGRSVGVSARTLEPGVPEASVRVMAVGPPAGTQSCSHSSRWWPDREHSCPPHGECLAESCWSRGGQVSKKDTPHLSHHGGTPGELPSLAPSPSGPPSLGLGDWWGHTALRLFQACTSRR